MITPRLLARLAQKKAQLDGLLEAVKRGRVWMTTRRAVAPYRQSVSEVTT